MNRTIFTLFIFILCLTGRLEAQQLLQDLRPGMDGSDPVVDNTVFYNGILYFSAVDGDGFSAKLFSTDATSVSRIAGDQSFTILGLLAVYNNELYFWGWDINGTVGPALYKSNMQPGQYELVYDLDPNSTSNFLLSSVCVIYNGRLFFMGSNDSEGFELWSTDGTSNGTYILKDIEPGSGSSIMNTSASGYFAVFENRLYFAAGNSTYGAELWSTDGTEAGTQMVKDIETDNSWGIPQYGSNPAYFTLFNNKLYFSAGTVAQGRELWCTDGTEAGTVLVRDLATGSADPSRLTVYNNHLYFNAYHDVEGWSLYKSDGTHAGTGLVRAFSNGGPESPEELVVYDGRLFFKGYDATVFSELWRSDGSVAGTDVAVNLSGNDQSAPRGFFPTTHYMYLQALNSAGEYKIFRGSGDMSNTAMISTDPTVTAEEPQMFLVNNCLLFVGNNGSTGKEFYKICNQNTGVIGVEELDVHTSCITFPNPAQDKFSVVSKNASFDNLRLRLMSMDGKLILQQTVGELSIGSVFELNIPSECPNGLYILILEEDNRAVFSGKISVLR